MITKQTIPLDQLFRVLPLPDPCWGIYWSTILISFTWFRRLQNYSTLFVTKGINNYVGASKMVIFHGPPGTGKTSMAKGFANVVAQKQASPTTGFWVNADSWKDYRLGESQKAISQAFEAIRMAARNGNVILIIDELEAVAISRQRTLNTSEPSDVLAAVNILLNQIDLIQSEYHVLVIATSNIIHAIDAAFLSRADLCVPFDLPDFDNRMKILEQQIAPLGKCNHQITDDVLPLLAEQTEGFSGRQLVKLPLQARLEADDVLHPVTIDDYLRVIEFNRLNSNYQDD